ncbi:hypothetical protein AAFF_G00304590 [Aldrovandia affinis]|uniref:Uncharacterized protein n=1 Tax=Aldrovandia affinis TaxID=143900 RepID=A0AAD7WRE4_9TELE|nr:hypothetical protein AAFF_G00304590 [Aldrovandia affinis]
MARVFGKGRETLRHQGRDQRPSRPSWTAEAWPAVTLTAKAQEKRSSITCVFGSELLTGKTGPTSARPQTPAIINAFLKVPLNTDSGAHAAEASAARGRDSRKLALSQPPFLFEKIQILRDRRPSAGPTAPAQSCGQIHEAQPQCDVINFSQARGRGEYLTEQNPYF